MFDYIDKLTLELIRKCTNNCLHCSSNSMPSANDIIDLNLAKSLVDQAVDLGVKKIILSGGEPLVYPDLLTLIQYINRYRVKVIIYTSGSIFDNYGRPIGVQKSTIDNLIKLGAISFNVSLHSSSPYLNDFFMGTPGSWERAIEFINTVITKGCDVHIHTVITKLNINDIRKLVILLDEMGVKNFRLLRLVPQGRAKQNLQLLQPQEEDWILFRKEISALDQYNLSRVRTRLGAHISYVAKQPKYECNLDGDKLLIEPDGSVCVCPALKGAKKILGSPKVTDESLISIIKSKWRNRVALFKKEESNGECPAQELYQQNLSDYKVVESKYAYIS